MYVLSRSYVGRVPENLKRVVRPRRHSPKTEEEDYNKLKRETLFSLYEEGLAVFFWSARHSRSLLNATDLISATHVVGLLVGFLVVRVHFGWFGMISTGRSCETWSRDLMRLGLIDSHENSCLTRVILEKISISQKPHERDWDPTLINLKGGQLVLAGRCWRTKNQLDFF